MWREVIVGKSNVDDSSEVRCPDAPRVWGSDFTEIRDPPSGFDEPDPPDASITHPDSATLSSLSESWKG